jgi:hypothetical protein
MEVALIHYSLKALIITSCFPLYFSLFLHARKVTAMAKQRVAEKLERLRRGEHLE